MTEIILPAIFGLLGAVIGSLISFCASKMAIQETVKQQEKDREHQLSMAELGKRLKAHQEAYAIWWDVFSKALGTDMSVSSRQDLAQDIAKGWGWWKNNCLYLSDSVNDDFGKFMAAATSHPVHEQRLVQSGITDSEREARQKRSEDNLKEMNKLGRTIGDAVGLPSFVKNPRSAQP